MPDLFRRFSLPFLGLGLPTCLQVDKLVQLLESPIFLRLRLQLLEVDSPSYPALLKSLYGILMLLPQVSSSVREQDYYEIMFRRLEHSTL